MRSQIGRRHNGVGERTGRGKDNGRFRRGDELIESRDVVSVLVGIARQTFVWERRWSWPVNDRARIAHELGNRRCQHVCPVAPAANHQHRPGCLGRNCGDKCRPGGERQIVDRQMMTLVQPFHHTFRGRILHEVGKKVDKIHRTAPLAGDTKEPPDPKLEGSVAPWKSTIRPNEVPVECVYL